MTKARLSILALWLVVSLPVVSSAQPGLLRTAHALDEVRGYCLDIAGFGATLRLDDPLQTAVLRQPRSRPARNWSSAAARQRRHSAGR